jgi:hypothetical protein
MGGANHFPWGKYLPVPSKQCPTTIWIFLLIWIVNLRTRLLARKFYQVSVAATVAQERVNKHSWIKLPRGALCFTNEQKNPNSFTFLRHGTARQHRWEVTLAPVPWNGGAMMKLLLLIIDLVIKMHKYTRDHPMNYDCIKILNINKWMFR